MQSERKSMSHLLFLRSEVCTGSLWHFCVRLSVSCSVQVDAAACSWWSRAECEASTRTAAIRSGGCSAFILYALSMISSFISFHTLKKINQDSIKHIKGLFYDIKQSIKQGKATESLGHRAKYSNHKQQRKQKLKDNWPILVSDGWIVREGTKLACQKLTNQ